MLRVRIASPGGRSSWNLRSATVEDVELEAGVWREELVHLLQAFGHGGRGQQRIFALAQFVVVHVQIQRQHIDSDGIGEGCAEIVILCLLVGGPARARAGLLSELMRVEACFTADLAIYLRPG